ncbi:MarR family transcriptional regulator, partial [Streptomyces sp. YC419]|nr:MarR family transcriptional regulator [Streptomyces ureilyticus]
PARRPAWHHGDLFSHATPAPVPALLAGGVRR